MTREVPFVAYSMVGVTPLPDFRGDAQLPARAKRETALGELDGPLQSDALAECEEKMDMIWHNREFMYQELALVPVGEKRGN